MKSMKSTAPTPNKNSNGRRLLHATLGFLNWEPAEDLHAHMNSVSLPYTTRQSPPRQRINQS